MINQPKIAVILKGLNDNAMDVYLTNDFIFLSFFKNPKLDLESIKSSPRIDMEKEWISINGLRFKDFEFCDLGFKLPFYYL